MSKLFGEKPKAPQVVRMPLPQDEESKAAQERQRRAIAGRSGRASTIMSRSRSGGGEAGTTSYGNSLLGSAG